LFNWFFLILIIGKADLSQKHTRGWKIFQWEMKIILRGWLVALQAVAGWKFEKAVGSRQARETCGAATHG